MTEMDSDKDGVVSEEDGLGWLVSRELVSQNEVSPLVTPLQDGHQVVVGSAEEHLALQRRLVTWFLIRTYNYLGVLRAGEDVRSRNVRDCPGLDWPRA